jgi:hypothetical protein
MIFAASDNEAKAVTGGQLAVDAMGVTRRDPDFTRDACLAHRKNVN